MTLVPLFTAALAGGCIEHADEKTAQTTQAAEFTGPLSGFNDACKDACDKVVDAVLELRSCDEATRRAAQQGCYAACNAATSVVTTTEEARAAIDEAVREMKEKTNVPFTAVVTAALDACHTTVEYVSAPTISATTGAAIVTVGLLVGGVAVIAACATGTAATGGLLALVCAPVTLQVAGAGAATVLLTVNMGDTANACSPAEVHGHTSCASPLEPDCAAATDQASCEQCVAEFEADACHPTTNGSLWGAPYWDPQGYCNVGWAGCDYK